MCMTNILFIALPSRSSSQELKEAFNPKVYAILRIIIVITYSMVVIISICLFNKECSFHFVRIIFRITEHQVTVSSPKTTRQELVQLPAFVIMWCRSYFKQGWGNCGSTCLS